MKNLELFTPNVIGGSMTGPVRILVYHTNAKQNQCIVAHSNRALFDAFKRIYTEEYSYGDRTFPTIKGYFEGNIVTPPDAWITQGREYNYQVELSNFWEWITSCIREIDYIMPMADTKLFTRCPYEVDEDRRDEDDRDYDKRYHNYCNLCDRLCWLAGPQLNIEELYWRHRDFYHKTVKYKNSKFRLAPYTNKLEYNKEEKLWLWSCAPGHHQSGIYWKDYSEITDNSWYSDTLFFFQGDVIKLPEYIEIYIKEQQTKKKIKEEVKAIERVKASQSREEKAAEESLKILTTIFPEL